MKSYCILKTTLLGDLILVANASQLIGVYFADCEHVPGIERKWELAAAHPLLALAANQIQAYLAGSLVDFSLPLHQDGTSFQRSVWREIAQIPFGKTIAYTDLAEKVRAPKAIRAAGTATGQNALSIIVPCHRVVAKGGGLGGYAGGLDRKRRLLELEANTAGMKFRSA